jgi:salicylate hydroxylase
MAGRDTLGDWPILIAGAGIGGLTSALMLAQNGFDVVVAERRTGVDEIGAGIQLSSNASRLLIDIGLGAALARAAGEPERLVVRRGESGARVMTMPMGKAVRDRYGAPHYVIHRADLQTILLDAVRSEPRIRLVFGRTVASVETQGDRAVVAMETANGPETRETGLLIGADGLWSRTASAVGDHTEARFCGYVAWRGTVPADRAPEPFRRAETGLWMGSSAHVVHYPVRGGKSVNVVAILADRNSEPGWSRPGDADMFHHRFKSWSADLRALFAGVEEWQVWSLFDRDPRRKWVCGRVALLGDAAHPVLPFLAQGGALAIEDAAVLAGQLARRPADLTLALETYQALRQARARRVQSAARFNGRAYHLPAPLAIARDLVLGGMGGDGLLSRYDWLYGWTPDKT